MNVNQLLRMLWLIITAAWALRNAVARIDAIVNSEAIERLAGKQLRKSLDAIRVECEVEQIRRHCRRCRKWSRT